jgi:hypothetical protein
MDEKGLYEYDEKDKEMLCISRIEIPVWENLNFT